MDPGGGGLELQIQEAKIPHTMIMQDFGTVILLYFLLLGSETHTDDSKAFNNGR